VVDLPAETSWRTLLLGKSAGSLLTGSVQVNLNPPCRIKDTSWIKPGLAFWDWRAWGATAPDGFKYNLDMASWRRFIDFASSNGVPYLVLDANWYGHEFDSKSNPVVSRKYLVYQPDPRKAKMASKPAPEPWDDPIDIPSLIKYGKERNVGVLLYINDVARKHYDFEKTLATYHEWGAAGIKYGFMRVRGQQKVLDTRKIVELCAKYELLCDFHDGPIPPSGDRRTYPNYVAREHCHAQSDARRSFTPTTFCTTVFCNMLAGPLDMNNGFFTLTGIEKVRPKVFVPVPSTVVSEAARVMIVFSGLAIIPDTPESYAAKADLFEFVKSLPLTWDETHILNSSIGEYITTARRSGKRWFIASACNEKGATLPIKFDFLKKGVTYSAVVYEDAPDAHYKTNKDAYRKRKITVRKDDDLKIVLAPGGGNCMIIAPEK
jgi:alpha-glucosidase